MGANLKMKILVTGGSGFIGRNFIEHIAREHPDYEIVEFSRSNANERLEQRRTKYTFVKGEIGRASCRERV